MKKAFLDENKTREKVCAAAYVVVIVIVNRTSTTLKPTSAHLKHPHT